jgi:hypothetical protein
MTEKVTFFCAVCVPVVRHIGPSPEPRRAPNGAGRKPGAASGTPTGVPLATRHSSLATDFFSLHETTVANSQLSQNTTQTQFLPATKMHFSALSALRWTRRQTPIPDQNPRVRFDEKGRTGTRATNYHREGAEPGPVRQAQGGPELQTTGTVRHGGCPYGRKASDTPALQPRAQQAVPLPMTGQGSPHHGVRIRPASSGAIIWKCFRFQV